MGNINYVVLYLFTLISMHAMYKSYAAINNIKMKITLKYIAILLISTLICVINTKYDLFGIRMVASYLIYIIGIRIIFKLDIRNIIINSLMLFVVMTIFDFIFSIIIYFAFLDTPDLSYFEGLVQGGFTLLVSLLSYFVCKSKPARAFSNKMLKFSNNNYFYIILSFITIVFITSLSIKLSMKYGLQSYFFDTFLLLLFMTIIVIAFLKDNLAQKEKREKEVLLEFISKYEKIIDENRENKHEMLNNLIILRSFDDRNDPEYDKVLNELIVRYGKNSGETVKNISKIPKGLKGILYYKMNDMKQKHINLTVSISQRVSSPLEKLETEEYVILSKIVGIIMDNALEAALKSKDKSVFIEVYEQNGIVIMVIENSCDSIVNVNDIKKKNFSTKGTGRGLCLHIAELLLKKSKHITMSQHSTDVFITKITIE